MRTLTTGCRNWLARMTTEPPPDIDEEPDIDPAPVGAPYATEYVPHEATALTHAFVPRRDPYAPVLNTQEDDPYKDLGGLARPDAYFGAIEFDCPTCKAKARTLDSDGERCRMWHERLKRHITRKMPCVARIRLAHGKGVL